MVRTTLYKERHDKVLYQVVLVLTCRYMIDLPEIGTLRVGRFGYFSTLNPTDSQMDMVHLVYAKRREHVYILEVACAWEPLVLKRVW